MSETLDYLFAQTFAMTGAVNCVRTDDTGAGVTVNLNTTTGTNYYRHVAARTAGGARTVANPTDFLYQIARALDPTGMRWRVSLETNCRARITYTGTGAASLDMTTAALVLVLLGFDSSIGSLTLTFAAPGAYKEAANLPTHAIFATQFFPDTGWVRKAQRVAGVEMPDGTMTAWSDRRPGLVREGDIGLIPLDWTFGKPIDAGTPMYPTDTDRYVHPADVEPLQIGPWSVLDQLGNQVGQRWGCCFGDLQAVLAGTATGFDVCSFRLDALRADGSNRPTSPTYDKRWQQSIALRFIERKART